MFFCYKLVLYICYVAFLVSVYKFVCFVTKIKIFLYRLQMLNEINIKSSCNIEMQIYIFSNTILIIPCINLQEPFCKAIKWLN